MWSSYQFILVIICMSILTTYQTNNLPQFAVYSELVWLGFFILSSLLGSVIGSPILLSGPFVILVLTGVEAVIIWTLVVYSFKLKL